MFITTVSHISVWLSGKWLPAEWAGEKPHKSETFSPHAASQPAVGPLTYASKLSTSRSPLKNRDPVPQSWRALEICPNSQVSGTLRGHEWFPWLPKSPDQCWPREFKGRIPVCNPHLLWCEDEVLTGTSVDGNKAQNHGSVIISKRS